jgi:hypothetical protein
VEACDVCGASLDTGGYVVVGGGRRYDPMECALRTQELNAAEPDSTSSQTDGLN